MSTVDAVVVGLGLAGSMLAQHLLQRGMRIRVYDVKNPNSASRVAAGIVQPVSGPRLTLDELAPPCLSTALTAYQTMPDSSATPLLQTLKMLRVFRDQAQHDAWDKRNSDARYAAYFGQAVEPGMVDGYKLPWGGYWQQQTYVLDFPRLLQTARASLLSKGLLVEQKLDPTTVHIESQGVRIGDCQARRLIFCEGSAALHNPWFAWLPFNPAKGEWLTLQTQSELPPYAVHAGHWLLPLDTYRFKFGASYSWNDTDATPSASTREALLRQLKGLRPVCSSIVEQHCGIRPCTLDTAPFLGRHPQHTSLAICNGFGSKGGLLVPHAVQRLCAHLFDDAPLPAAWDIALYHERYVG